MCVAVGVGSRALKARLLLTEVESPVPGRPSTPHITSTTPVPFPYGCTHMKLKPAHLHTPPFTTPVDRLKVCVKAAMSSHSLKAMLLLTEVQSPVLRRPSTPSHHKYKPYTLSQRLYSHEAQAGTPSRASFHHHPRRPAQSGCGGRRGVALTHGYVVTH